MGVTALALMGAAPPAHAETPTANTFVNSTQDFYLYANAGETVNVTFTRASVGTDVTTDFPITIQGPGGQGTTCTVNAGAAGGATVCNYSTTSTVTGVWRVAVRPDAADASTTSPWFPGYVFTNSAYTWNINVATHPGRVWGDSYQMWQPSGAGNVANITFYYQGQDGYLYKADYNQYDGIFSQFLADGIGNRTNGTCTPVYQSIEGTDTTRSPAMGTCGSQYRAFYTTPATDMPQTSTKWDGTSTWVLPATPVNPTVSNLSFTQDVVNSYAGNVNFKISDFVGPLDVQIDTNNNGSYNDPVDVTIPYAVPDTSNTTRQVHWDGKDGQGNNVVAPNKVNLRIQVNKAAEIHLFNYDVEGREGGVTLTRQNGPGAGSALLSWNDSNLTNDHSNTTSPLQANGVDSSAGVHGWLYDTASWGNGRLIEDWTFANVTAQGTLQISFPRPIDAVNDTGNSVSTVTGGTSYNNVLVNDTLDGVTPTLTPAQPNTVTISQVSTTNPGVTLDTATGAVNVAPGTPIGNYSLVYEICDTQLTTNCDTATVTVPVVQYPIVATDDSDTTPQNTPVTTDVLVNDTLNGNPVDSSTVKVTPVTDPTRGTIVVNPDNTVTYTPFDGFAGTDTYVYRVCETPTSTNCDTATVTITVTGTPQIIAKDNTGATMKAGQGGVTVQNVLDNDKYNGVGATLSEVTLTQVSTSNPGVTVDPATGQVNVAASVPAGSYTLRYRICSKTIPNLCAEANVTVDVTPDGQPLADTGSSLPLILSGALVLVLGGVGLLVVRHYKFARR